MQAAFQDSLNRVPAWAKHEKRPYDFQCAITSPVTLQDDTEIKHCAAKSFKLPAEPVDLDSSALTNTGRLQESPVFAQELNVYKANDQAIDAPNGTLDQT